MPTYILTDNRYGRKLKVTGNRPPTTEEQEKFFNEAFNDDLVYDNLIRDEKYLKDIRDSYKKREGESFKGTNQELVEQEFEYWNLVDNNLAYGAKKAFDFSNLDKEDKQRMLRLYDVYDRTQAFGEGSRSFWEQFKGVGKAALTDPTNYLGGAGILYKLGAKGTAKGLGKKVIEKALFPIAAGASWASIANVEKQAREKSLEGRAAFDFGETADAALTGAVVGPLAPFATKKAGQLTEGLIKTVASLPTKETRRKGKESLVRTLGGQTTAQRGVIKELEDEIGGGDTGLATSSLFNMLGTKRNNIKKQFRDRYAQVGEFSKLTVDDINNLVVKLEEKNAAIPAVKQTLKLLEEGKTTPTKALKALRQDFGNAEYQSYFGKGEMAGWTDEYKKDVVKDVRDLWRNKAIESGQRDALALDANYSRWLNFSKRNNKMFNKLEDETAINNLINGLTNNPKTSNANFKALTQAIAKIKDFTDDPTLQREGRKQVIEAVKGSLFEKNGDRLRKFLLDPQGVRTLKNIFPEIDGKKLDDFSTIMKNAEGSTSVGLWLARFFATALGWKGTGGAVPGAISSAVALKSLDTALSSETFRKMAMNAYKKGEVKEPVVNGMIKWIQNNTPLKSKEGLEALRKQLVGTATIVGGKTYLESDNEQVNEGEY